MIARAIRAPRFGWAFATLTLLAASTSCTRVPLTAPTKSTIALFASSAPSGDGALTLTATVTEEAGTPVQNGTLVSFTTTLGHLDPTSARTTNGQASVKFFSDGQSGTATVSAFSGGATSASGDGTANSASLTIPLGGAAADNILVHAEPSSVPLNGGTTKIVAQVRDSAGNGLPNVLVAFSTTAGTLQSPSVATDGTGSASTNLTTTSKATVTASAGGKSATVDVNVAALPTITLSASANPVVGQPVTFTIGVDATNAINPVKNVRIDFGDGDFEDLGAATGSTTASHVYDSDGNRTVTVTVTDTANQQAKQVLALVVSPSVPIGVTLTASENPATKGVPVNFTATATVSGTVAIESYDWSFGDTTTKTTTGGQTSKVYNSTGTFHVRVVAHATDGSTGVGDIDVKVNNP